MGPKPKGKRSTMDGRFQTFDRLHSNTIPTSRSINISPTVAMEWYLSAGN